jgi:hypothetical protein
VNKISGDENLPFLFMDVITEKEYNRILDRLERWTDKSFVLMWKNCGRMVFSDEYDIAALEIVDGVFRINVNPRYWKRITKYQKVFLICHEFLHVMLGHWLSPSSNLDMEWVNIAQDIQVNECILKTYPILVQHMKGRNNMPWIDTVFKHKAYLVEKDRDYLYYYGLLMKCLK